MSDGSKQLNRTDMTNADFDVSGKPGDLRVLCKASSKRQNWMKSTKWLNIYNGGTLLQFSTELDAGSAEREIDKQMQKVPVRRPAETAIQLDDVYVARKVGEPEVQRLVKFDGKPHASKLPDGFEWIEGQHQSIDEFIASQKKSKKAPASKKTEPQNAGKGGSGGKGSNK